MNIIMKFRLADGVCIPSGDAARILLAKMDRDRRLPRSLWHRDDEAGTLKHGLSPFQFYAHGNVMTILAFGVEAATMALASVLTIASVLDTNQYEVHPATVGAELSPSLGCMNFQRLVVQGGNGRWAYLGRGLTLESMRSMRPDLDARVVLMLRGGIERFAELSGVILPEDLNEIVFGDVELTKLTSVPVANGTLSYAAVSGSVRTNLAVSGPWNVGRLASKGCGHLSTVYGSF
jgi:hypothetical protein